MKKAKHSKMNNNLIKIFAIFFIGILLIIYLSEINSNAKEEETTQIVKRTANQVMQNNSVISEESQDSKTNEEIQKTQIPTEYKGFSVIAKLEIPKINLETYVLENYSVQALTVSVTKFYGGEPNEIGNFFFFLHNYVVKNMFHNLK